MKLFKLLLLATTVTALAGCGTARKFEKTKVKSVKNVAVVIYTVPQTISYSSNSREAGSKGLLASAMGAAGAGSGADAATLSHKTFIENMQNAKDLPFTVMSYKDMMANKNFRSLYTPPKEEKKSALTSALGFIGVGKKIKDGAAPANLNQYGIAPWEIGTAISGTEEEMVYIKKAIAALNVDAVLVINDPGFSFSCEACIAQSGAASTGSAFNATLLTKDGDIIMDIHEYFLTTDAQAAMVTGAVNPLQHESLFKEHGKKTAVVLAKFISKELNAE